MFFRSKVSRSKSWIETNAAELYAGFLQKLSAALVSALGKRAEFVLINPTAAAGFCFWCVSAAIAFCPLRERQKEQLIDYHNANFVNLIHVAFRSAFGDYIVKGGIAPQNGEAAKHLGSQTEYDVVLFQWLDVGRSKARSLVEGVSQATGVSLANLSEATEVVFLTAKLKDAFVKKGGLIFSKPVPRNDEQIVGAIIGEAFTWAFRQTTIGFRENAPIRRASPY